MKVPTEEVQNDSSPMRRVLALVPAMVSFEVSAQLSRTAQTVESTALSLALHSQKPTASSAYYSSGRVVTHKCSALHMRVPSQLPPFTSASDRCREKLAGIDQLWVLLRGFRTD